MARTRPSGSRPPPRRCSAAASFATLDARDSRRGAERGAARRDPDRRAAAVVDLFAETGLVASKGEARRTVSEGGAYVNNVRITDADARADAETCLPAAGCCSAGASATSPASGSAEPECDHECAVDRRPRERSRARLLPEAGRSLLPAGRGDGVLAGGGRSRLARLPVRAARAARRPSSTGTTAAGYASRRPDRDRPDHTATHAHPRGEVEMARGAAAAGSLVSVSSNAGSPFADIAAAGRALVGAGLRAG